MPLESFQFSCKGLLQGGIWCIDESEEWFREKLILYPPELELLSGMLDGLKRRQWLASRYLIRYLLNPTNPLVSLTGADGSPRLDGADLHLSISHSENLAGVLISSPDYLPGIDIELVNRKIPLPVQNRFLHPQERNQLIQAPSEDQNTIALLCWSAKESLFKCIGRKGVSFKNDLLLHLPVQIVKGRCTIMYGRVRNHGNEKQISIAYYVDDKMLCTWLTVPLSDFRM